MKQTLFDILIVMVVPMLIIGGYFSVKNVGGTQELYETITGKSVPKAGEPGARTSQALDELVKIQLDTTIFSYAEFNTMKFTPVEIKTEKIGRTNPFMD